MMMVEFESSESAEMANQAQKASIFSLTGSFIAAVHQWALRFPATTAIRPHFKAATSTSLQSSDLKTLWTGTSA